MTMQENNVVAQMTQMTQTLVEGFNNPANYTAPGVLVVLEDEFYKQVAGAMGVDMETANKVHSVDQAYAIAVQEAFGDAVVEHQKTFEHANSVDEYVCATRLQYRNVDVEARRAQVDDHEFHQIIGNVKTEVYDTDALSDIRHASNAQLEALYRNAMQSV